MRISRLKIDGFRGVLSGDLSFGTHSVIVGPNNVGKTTVIEALALLLGRDRLVRNLTEHDFHGSQPTEQSRILIIATLTDFAHNDANRHREWFSPERGVEKWLDPATDTLHASQDQPQWKLAVQIGVAARFDAHTLEAEIVRFYVDDETGIGDPFDDQTHIRPLRGRTLQEVGFFLVSATRTWDRWISFSSELFRRVVATVGNVPAGAVRAERDRLRQPTDRLEEAVGLADVVSNINEELSHLISNAPTLKLRLTSTDSEGVMQAVIPHFQQGGGPILPSSRHGSGLASLQSLLLLMQFGAARTAQQQCFVLAVEEPELHVQPSQQKRLVNRLNAVCNQTVITTHSPTVASMFPPDDVLFLSNAGGTLRAIPLSGTAAVAPSNHQQHLFYGWRDRLVGALMHEFVIVPEGASDVAWLETLETSIALRQTWQGADGEPTRFGTFVGVAPTVDAKVAETYGVCRVVHGNVLCLVDGDAAGLGYLGELTALGTPPRIVFAWPDGWALERTIAWIAEAAWQPASVALEAALGVPLPDAGSLRDHLLTIKSHPPSQIIVAEALVGIPACRLRVRALLDDMADVARSSTGARRHFALDAGRSTAYTAVWRLSP